MSSDSMVSDAAWVDLADHTNEVGLEAVAEPGCSHQEPGPFGKSEDDVHWIGEVAVPPNIGGRLCVGFVRGDDERYPAFGEERLAFSYMADWLRRGRIFR